MEEVVGSTPIRSAILFGLERSLRLRMIAEHFGCVLRLLGFSPMQSGSQRFVSAAI
jgi:hypothetical protein